MMEANKDPWSGAWRWVETLGVPMVEVPESLFEDLLKLRRIYPDIQEMVANPVSLGGSGAKGDPDAD